MKNEESRFSPSAVFEGMTSVRSVLYAIENGISDRRIIKVLYAEEKEKSKEKELNFLRRKSKEHAFTVESTSLREIDEITTGNSHGGIAAYCTNRTIDPLTPDRIENDSFYVMLEGIEDPYNFGYALRTIYAAGAGGVVLTPRNWMSAAGVVCRSSAGASEMLPIYISEPKSAISVFRSRSYKIAGAGIRNSVSAFETDLTCPLFLIVGGEKRGISAETLDLCDCIVRLDYGREFRGSLSAASAASVLSYEVLRQNINKIKNNMQARDT